MTPQEWFDRLAAELPDGEIVDVGDDEREALLDLARVAAHGSERWTAPITTFLVGIALADVAENDRVATLRRLVETFNRPA